MVVLLPREGKKITDVLNSLMPRNGLTISKKCHNTKVNLSLPRFTTTYNQQLNSIGTSAGVCLWSSIQRKRDFSRLSTTPSYVSRILQNAKIEVDEQGTKAAAATVVENGLTAIGPESEVVFKADHPSSTRLPNTVPELSILWVFIKETNFLSLHTLMSLPQPIATREGTNFTTY